MRGTEHDQCRCERERGAPRLGGGGDNGQIRRVCTGDSAGAAKKICSTDVQRAGDSAKQARAAAHAALGSKDVWVTCPLGID